MLTANPATAFSIAMETALYSSKRGGDIRREKKTGGKGEKTAPKPVKRECVSVSAFFSLALTDFTAPVAHHLSLMGWITSKNSQIEMIE